MTPSSLTHRRTHNLLLISKLLNQRDHASPFTLVLDTLEQPSKPLLREYLRRAKLAKTFSIFLSFETFVQPNDVDTVVSCYDKNPSQIMQAVANIVARSSSKRCLIIVDSLLTLATLSTRPASNLNLTAYLSSLLQPPKSTQPVQISLVGVYHTDIPINTSGSPYSPQPLSVLSYLATTIMTVHSLPILMAEKSARDTSQAPPSFGLAEEVGGLLIGLKSAAKTLRMDEQGIVIELEHRRKSGRGVLEFYFLPTTTSSSKQVTTPQTFRENIILLDDHPYFRRAKEELVSDQELTGMTFELGLTDRQKQEREGVVLPYFDAQKTGGVGEGGRILYDMGVEDDFDDEEDEI